MSIDAIPPVQRHSCHCGIQGSFSYVSSIISTVAAFQLSVQAQTSQIANQCWDLSRSARELGTALKETQEQLQTLIKLQET